MSKTSDTMVEHSIRCRVCHTEILKNTKIHQVGIGFSVVCDKCYTLFGAEDVEMMVDLFIAYGGYFGMVKNTSFSLFNMLEEVLRDHVQSQKRLNTEQVNIEMMHKALLHGITPQQYVKQLSFLVNK